MSRIVLGIDLGGTNIKAAVVTADREVLGKISRGAAAESGPSGVMEAMAAAVDEALAAANRSRRDVVAVGIGAPGPMDWRSGVVFSPPNLPGWKDVPLGAEMSERLGVPCFVDNDANVACFGEFWMGAGQGVQNMCLLTLGTGVGGGLVVNGELVRGIDGTAAEIGHLKVARGGRVCGCGATGCLEAYGSVSGMVRTAVEGLESGRESVLTQRCEGVYEKITGALISQCAEDGDAFARSVIEETGEWLGVGISSLINLLNPERVILCGGMIAAGETLFKPIRETAARLSFEVPARRAQIVPAGLGADSGVLGAAGCALARLEETV